MRFSILTTACRSSKANPLSTLLILTHISFIPLGLECCNNSQILCRASAFLLSVTESSRSYATVSTDHERDFSSMRFDELGTACCGVYLLAWMVTEGDQWDERDEWNHTIHQCPTNDACGHFFNLFYLLRTTQ